MYRKNEKVAVFTVLTFVFLLLISLVPETKLPYIDYTIKRVDLFSDIRIEKENKIADILARDLSANIDSMAIVIDVSKDSLLANQAYRDSAVPVREQKQKNNNSISFEDYSVDKQSVQELVERLTSLKKGTRSNFRIGFLGDSFIEGDILTEYIRKQLQNRFGGRGVGFVPVSHIAAKSHSSINHSFDGWESYSMINPKGVDKTKLTISGNYFIPNEGATISYKLSGSNRKRNKSKKNQFPKAQLFFINQSNAKIKAVVNDSVSYEYYPDSSPNLQTITIDTEAYSLDFKFESVKGLIVYGVYLNDEIGIYVDNFSMRGSSGMILSVSDSLLSEHWRAYKDYDMLVLEYGLNVISKDILNYNAYKKNMIDVIEILKKQFPNTLFLVMGIGDRGYLKDGQVCTMPEVFAMIKAQRELAKEAKVLFWDTFSAMGGVNSIEHFVNSNPPLANKDFVHINRAGGQFIANEFVKSITSELEK